MAVIAIMAGGVLGFFCTAAALITLNLSWLAAIGLWWSSGSVIAVLLLLAMLSPRGESRANLANEQA